MIERFTDEELKQIVDEIEEKRQLHKSRLKSNACTGELASIKSALSEQTGAMVSGWAAIRSALLCYCDLINGNFTLDRYAVTDQPFVSIVRPKTILDDVDLEQYKKTLREVSETIITNLQRRIDEPSN